MKVLEKQRVREMIEQKISDYTKGNQKFWMSLNSDTQILKYLNLWLLVNELSEVAVPRIVFNSDYRYRIIPNWRLADWEEKEKIDFKLLED